MKLPSQSRVSRTKLNYCMLNYQHRATWSFTWQFPLRAAVLNGHVYAQNNVDSASLGVSTCCILHCLLKAPFYWLASIYVHTCMWLSQICMFFKFVLCQGIIQHTCRLMPNLCLFIYILMRKLQTVLCLPLLCSVSHFYMFSPLFDKCVIISQYCFIMEILSLLIQYGNSGSPVNSLKL
jgi:hypothetical protein